MISRCRHVRYPHRARLSSIWLQQPLTSRRTQTSSMREFFGTFRQKIHMNKVEVWKALTTPQTPRLTDKVNTWLLTSPDAVPCRGKIEFYKKEKQNRRWLLARKANQKSSGASWLGQQTESKGEKWNPDSLLCWCDVICDRKVMCIERNWSKMRRWGLRSLPVQIKHYNCREGYFHLIYRFLARYLIRR